MDWIKDESYNVNRKAFHAEVDGVSVINIECWKNYIKQPWEIEIHGWNVKNFSFKWYKRFHQQDVLDKVENIIKNVSAAKLVIFNRIFEGIHEK